MREKSLAGSDGSGDQDSHRRFFDQTLRNSVRYGAQELLCLAHAADGIKTELRLNEFDQPNAFGFDQLFFLMADAVERQRLAGSRRASNQRIQMYAVEPGGHQ